MHHAFIDIALYSYMKVPEILQYIFLDRIYSTKSDHNQHNHCQHSGICPMGKQSVIK